MQERRGAIVVDQWSWNDLDSLNADREGISYKFIVGDNFDVNACECGTGLKFRPSEGLMELGEPNQIIHG